MGETLGIVETEAATFMNTFKQKIARTNLDDYNDLAERYLA